MKVTNPIMGKIGARVEGFDCSRALTDAVKNKLKLLLRENKVLIFPQQDLTKKQYIDFAKIFGNPHIYPYAMHLDKEYAEISHVSNVMDKLGTQGVTSINKAFHADGIDYSFPTFNTVLMYAQIVPKEGGETYFIDAMAAYEALSDAEKKQIENKVALYACIDNPAMPNTPKPLVVTHPNSVYKSLILDAIGFQGIKGMPTEQAKALYDKLCQHIEKPEFWYTHYWSLHEVVVWANDILLHAASLPIEQKRQLWRIQLHDH